MASLRSGGELATVFTSKDAARDPRTRASRSLDRVVRRTRKILKSFPKNFAPTRTERCADQAVHRSLDAAIPIKTYSPELMVVPKYGKL